MYLLVVLSGFFIFLSSLGLKKNRADGAGRYLNLTFVVGIASVISWSVTLIMRESVTKDMFLFALPFSALFVLGMIYGYKAYESGSMTVTALF
ncbi:MAG: hypothetical protein IIX01_00390 [Clostridia bacterium]|nr:hypothetical protein [Clostridia bacterium]